MKRTKDKGFSLIELIIVIAIMAVLVGVAAPLYVGYVEKSEKIVRLERAEEFRKCFDIAVVEVQSEGVADRGGENLFTVSPNGSLSPQTDYNNAIKDALDNSFGSNYEGLCVNVMYNTTDGIPFQYHLTFEEADASYEYCFTLNEGVLQNLESFGYTEQKGTGWYFMKSEAPVLMTE